MKEAEETSLSINVYFITISIEYYEYESTVFAAGFRFRAGNRWRLMQLVGTA
jgi:hypothetical protein